MKHRGGGPHFRTSRDIFTGHACFISAKETGSLISAYPNLHFRQYCPVEIQVSLRA
jgi:hypothetical protein